MNDLETRLVTLDLLIARTRLLMDRQEKDLRKDKSYRGDDAEAKELLAGSKKALKSAKTERKTVIAKLLRAEDTKAKRK